MNVMSCGPDRIVICCRCVCMTVFLCIVYVFDFYVVYVRNRVGPQVEKSPNLHITRDSTGSIHENVRGKKFDPKKVRLGWGDLI